MDMQFCGNATPGNPSEGLCDEYRLSTMTHIDELFAACAQIIARHPGCRPLVSLDDLPQARYTSGHARQSIDLDQVTELDLAGLPPECFEDGEYVGFMTTKAEFPICVRNFAALTAGASFSDACSHGLTLDAEGVAQWVGYQQEPLALLDQPVSALVVPVAQASEALSAFPNGYFSCDLGPVHNFAVARHLAQHHGYQLIGVGAAYLGFLRAAPADPDTARAVAADFCALYNVTDEQREGLAATVAQAVLGRTYLWLRYVE